MAAQSQGRFAEAERIARAILGRDPRQHDAACILGSVASVTGRPREAIDAFNLAIRIDPRSRAAHYALSDLFQRQGRLNDMVAVWEHLVSVLPMDADAHARLGRCLTEIGRSELALQCLQRAAKLQPLEALYHYNLAVALQRMGNVQRAADSFRRCLKVDPSATYAQVDFASLLLSQGKSGEARQLLEAALELDPSLSGAHLQLAEILTADGDETGAREHIALAKPKDPMGALAIGRMLQMMGRFDEAVLSFEEAIRGMPSCGAAYYGLVRLVKQTDPNSPVIEGMRRAAADPNLSSEDREALCYALGKAMEDVEDYESSFRYYKTANEAGADSREPSFDLDRQREEFDGLIRRFTPELFQRLRPLASESDLPVFIVGMIRSGTTLVEHALNRHPMIGAGGELRFWYERRPEVARLLDSPDAEEAARLEDEFLSTLVGHAPSALRVIDKQPLNYMVLGNIHLLFPKARIIHCRRNPADTCFSIYATPFYGAPPFGHSLANIAGAYRQYQRLMEHWKSVIPSEMLLEVDYEEIVSSAEGSMRRIVDFLGLDWDERVLSDAGGHRTVKTPSSWQVRQPIYMSSVGRADSFAPWLGDLGDFISKST